MQTDTSRQTWRARVLAWLVHGLRAGCGLAALALGSIAAASNLPVLVHGANLERRLADTSEDRLVIDASAGALVAVLEQQGVDVVPRCENEAHARNAQTGRWGPEILLVEGICNLTVRVRTSGIPVLMYRIRVFSVDSPEGRRLPREIWSLWSQAHYDGGAEDVQGNTRALEKLRQVERAVAERGDSDELRYLRLGNAHLLRRTGQHAEAILAYDAFLQTLKSSGDSVWRSRANNGKGLSLRELDRFDDADRAFAEAEREGADRRDAYEWVSARNNRCLILHHYGKLAEARDCYAAVIPDYRTAAPNQIAVPLANLAAAADALGEPALALKSYRAALEQRRGGADRSSLGFVLLNLADHEARTGAWPSALEHSLEAQQLFEALGDRARIASSLRLRGFIYNELGEAERARGYFAESLQAARESKSASAIAMARSAQAAAEPDHALAAAAHREAISHFEQTHQAGLAGQEWVLLAERLDAMNDTAGRDSALVAGEALLQASGSRAYRSRAALLRGRIALRADRLADATAHATDAIMLRQEIRDMDGLAAARLFRARVARRAGQQEQALTDIEHALQELQRAERLPASPTLAANLYDRRVELLDEAIDILLGGGTAPEAAVSRAWSFKWTYSQMPDAADQRVSDASERELLDELRAKVMLLSGIQTPGFPGTSPPPAMYAATAKRVEDIESQLDARQAQAAAQHATALPLPALAASLLPGEALVSISLGAQASGAWISTAEGTQWVVLPAGRETITAFADAVQREFDLSALSGLSRAFAPMMAATGKAKRIVIVPDGPSHQVPFAALRDDSGQYWVEHSSIVLLEGPPTSAAQLRPVALAEGFPVVVWGAQELPGTTPRLALSRAGSVYRSGGALAELPAVAVEMQQMQKILGMQRVIAGDPRAASAPAGAARWMLHVAGHGLASARHPYAAALALPGAGDSAFDFLAGSSVQFGSRPPSIVFINICEGYSGRQFASQPPSTLARQFLRAGADVVVAASQPIEDMQAARFAQRLYDAFNQYPGDIADAVARAQRQALEAGGPRSLRYWAGYSVVQGR